MNQFEFVRWFTDDDHTKLKLLISYHQDKNNSESQLSWLQSHCDLVIKMHDDYYKKLCEIQLNKIKILQDKVDINNARIDAIKNGSVEFCICGAELKYRSSGFVGCSSYREFNALHPTFNYKKDIYKSIEPYISLDYLAEICKTIMSNYKVKIQASNLYEFYNLNNVELWRDDITRDQFYRLKKTSELSKKRELLIKSILEQNKIRFGYQKQIMYKLKYKKQTHAIPDFIAKINDDLLIIEQKKNIDNCADHQVDFYRDLLKFMYPKKDIHIIYVVEEDSSFFESQWDVKYPVYTVEQFKKYISEL